MDHNNFQFRWRNFRSFRDTGWLEIKPLTVVLGPNNSGKSSLTAPLLVLAQTLQVDDAKTSLVTRGPLIDVGRYKDFVFQGDERKPIQFGLRFHYHEDAAKAKALGTYPPGSIDLVFDRPLSKTGGPELRRYGIYDIYYRNYGAFVRSRSGAMRFVGPLANNLSKLEANAIKKADPINYLVSSNTIMRRRFDLLRKGRPDSPKAMRPFSDSFSGFMTVISFTYSEVRGHLMNISYIGPLRDKARRYYEALGEQPESIGSRGENAPHVLRNNRQTLPEVNRWVTQFGFGGELDINDWFSDVFSIVLKEKIGNRVSETNLADTGFGASQVFPLIVQAVSSKKPSFTIAEQPEIHLNPRLQCSLADLFVSMAKSGRHVLVETHSEHLLLRLRTLVANGAIEPKDVAIYFVEKRDGESGIRRIPVDELGHIEETSWPEGFFAESLNLSLGLAEAQMRAGKRAKRKTQ